MGLPVLTRVGRSFSARVAASLLSAVGLPELAAESAERYEDMAVMLANDAQIQSDIRTHLEEQRMALPLFDSTRFTRELGDLFGRMADRWQQGLPPAQLPAADAHAPTATN
jgi:predicted O-linked N-acetylglucosamine transferase (SPINDLY family)